MTREPTVLVLHERVSPGAAPDHVDVLVQAEVVGAALTRLGYGCERLEVDGDLSSPEHALRAARPQLVFNLVESLNGSGEHIHAVPALLEHLGLAFTGAGAETMRLTTDKIAAKRELRTHGIATPDWWTDELAVGKADARWIVKSTWEDASHGLDDDSVVVGTDAARRRLAASRSQWGGEWFAERYVEGREFNVSLLAGPNGPAALPLAEIEFRDFPPGKPRMVGYRAKWEEASFEYRNTVPRFVDEDRERHLAGMLRSLAHRCWELFGLRGYARVDFRVDAAGLPWVLEVNANPCLSPDAGFRAALAQAGISFDDAIARLIADSDFDERRIIPGDIHKRTAARLTRR